VADESHEDVVGEDPRLRLLNQLGQLAQVLDGVDNHLLLHADAPRQDDVQVLEQQSVYGITSGCDLGM
jgi:hypothetical protein